MMMKSTPSAGLIERRLTYFTPAQMIALSKYGIGELSGPALGQLVFLLAIKKESQTSQARVMDFILHPTVKINF
jgi:hypothetical protein